MFSFRGRCGVTLAPLGASVAQAQVRKGVQVYLLEIYSRVYVIDFVWNTLTNISKTSLNYNESVLYETKQFQHLASDT
jgi:hypothetical protein